MMRLLSDREASCVEESLLADWVQGVFEGMNRFAMMDCLLPILAEIERIVFRQADLLSGLRVWRAKSL